MAIEIYSTDTDSGVISVIRRNDDGTHIALGQIAVGNAPRGSVRFTKYGRGYVSNCGGDTISEIDIVNHRETARIKVGAAPRGIGIVPGDQFALVSNSGANSISIVDLNGREEVRQIATGRDPRHMAITPDGSSAYVAIWGSHYVAKIDTRTLVGDSLECNFRNVREVNKIYMADGSHPYSVALHPSGKRLFVANTQSERLAVVELENETIEHEIDLGSTGARAVAFSPDGAMAFVTIENTSEIAVIDVARMTIEHRILVGNGPRGLAMDPPTMKLYVSAFTRTNTGLSSTFPDPNALTVVDVREALATKARGAGISSVPVAKGSCSVAILDLAKRHACKPSFERNSSTADSGKPDRRHTCSRVRERARCT